MAANAGLEAAAEAGGRAAAVVARHYRLRTIMGTRGAHHVLKCGHEMPINSLLIEDGRPAPKQRRCLRCPNLTQVCVCSGPTALTGQTPPHWLDGHFPRCRCGCTHFRPVRIKLT
jgi:hypothetical protein